MFYGEIVCIRVFHYYSQYPLLQSQCSCVVYFLYFKHKTAYEMRISDWSSDVCSPDLLSATCTLPTPAICAASLATASTPEPATSRWTSPSFDAAVTVASVASLTALPSCSTQTRVFISNFPLFRSG